MVVVVVVVVVAIVMVLVSCVELCLSNSFCKERALAATMAKLQGLPQMTNFIEFPCLTFQFFLFFWACGLGKNIQEIKDCFLLRVASTLLQVWLQRIQVHKVGQEPRQFVQTKSAGRLFELASAWFFYIAERHRANPIHGAAVASSGRCRWPDRSIREAKRPQWLHA